MNRRFCEDCLHKARNVQYPNHQINRQISFFDLLWNPERPDVPHVNALPASAETNRKNLISLLWVPEHQWIHDTA